VRVVGQVHSRDGNDSWFVNASEVQAYGGSASPAPAVTGLSPGSGPTAGGTEVTVTGTGFTGATAVSFGGTAATSFAVNSDTQITATAPDNAVCEVVVIVTSVHGTA